MKNLDMTEKGPHTGIGIIMCQIQLSLIVVWHPYSSLPCLCTRDERLAVGQSLIQTCKEDMAGSLSPEIRWKYNRCVASPLQSVNPFARCISVSLEFV
ncbi:uncharacterized protein TNCV_2508941 [Trichonephila clavipes]|nr:uncharacterized protein TNCV_2508941 [Trichonephila clavipes]